MSGTPLVKNQKNMMVAREAADMVGYSLDYVSRLAREEKIIGERRGRQWFVDVESLKLFSLEAKAEQRKRQEQLREDRKVELLAVQKKILADKQAESITAFPTVAVGKVSVLMLSLALLMTLSWNAYDARLNLQALTIGALDITSLFQSVFAPSVAIEDEVVINESRGLRSEQRGMVVFDADEAVANVAETFSDQVEVEFTDEHSGVIRPQFRDADEIEYQFLMVPVNVSPE